MALPSYRSLPVKLTEAERMARFTTAAEKEAAYRAFEDQKKATTRDLGQQMKALRVEIKDLLTAGREGSENQQVQIDHRRNEERRTIETVRLDTKEIIDSRPMTVEERQGKLFSIDGGKAKDAKDDTRAAKAEAKARAAAGDKGKPSAKSESGKPRKRAASAKPTGKPATKGDSAPTDPTTTPAS